MTRLSVRRTGDWNRARRALLRLDRRLSKEIHGGLKEEAQAAARRIVNNIYTQAYQHAPHSENTVKQGDSRVLIESSDYVNAIKAFHVGGGVWGVGVENDEKLAKIGAAHEHGAPSKNLPSRPVYAVELERIRAGRLRSIREGVDAVLRGRDIF